MADGDGSAARVRVAHEALLTHWERARLQIAADRRDLRVRARLEMDEARWREAQPQDRDGSLLPPGRRLAEGEELLARRRTELDPPLVSFIGASVRAAREADRRRIRVRRYVTAALGAAAIVAAGFAAVGWYEQRQAVAANETVGVVQRLDRHTSDIGTRPQRSLLLSVYAASLSRDIPGGKALGAIDGLRQQLRVTGGRPLPGHEKSTKAAAFSSDGRWLATGSDDGTIRLWNLMDADPTRQSVRIGRHDGAVRGLAFSPDGTWLISSGADGKLRFWRRTAEGASAGPVFSGREHGPIQTFAISPNGDWLVFGTQNGNVCIWKLSAAGPAEAPCEIGKQKGPVTRVQFSPKRATGSRRRRYPVGTTLTTLGQTPT